MTAKHVLGLSGGRDSAALAVYMKHYHPELDIEYFFTDTGKELPEVYSYLNKLEGFLGKPIVRLNVQKGFDYWLENFNYFLPSPTARWCTRKLKLEPFQEWVDKKLENNGIVYSYVAIRADEENRSGYVPHNPNLIMKFPFKEDGYDKQAVIDLLDSSGLGLPEYYKWRSRSGCTFCFYQQKIEWVRLKEKHPEAFEEAKAIEKIAIENKSPFLWMSKTDSLETLENPEKIAQIQKEHKLRQAKLKQSIPINPLHKGLENEIDDSYASNEEGSNCFFCHK